MRLCTAHACLALSLLLSPQLFAGESKAGGSTTAALPTGKQLSAWKLPDVVFPESNPYSPEKAMLGRQLFFEPRLSSSRSSSCANCHHPGLGWADALPRTIRSHQALVRHTPSLINIAYSTSFFWDGRAKTLEDAIEHHLTSRVDMPLQTEREIAARIGGMKAYHKQFRKLFDSEQITTRHVAAALATFVRTIIIRDTAFDRWIGGDKSALSKEAIAGFGLFTGKAGCVSCHTPPYFSDFKYHNTGLNSIDPGRFEVTHDPRDHNAFRTPGLRQVARTAPYMHTGTKKTLLEVIRFYNQGGERPAGNNHLQPLHLNEEEIRNLLAFLHSLSGPPIAVTVPALPVSGD